MTIASAMALSFAVAQDYDDEYDNNSTSSEPATESAAEPAPAAPAAPAFDEPATAAAPATANVATLAVLHGNSYNGANTNTAGLASLGAHDANLAGANTIAGNLAVPYKMNGFKGVYVEPSNEFGTLAINMGGMTLFGAFDNSYGLGLTTVGFANSLYGLAVDFALNKNWTSVEQGDNEQDVSVTGAGDIIKVKFGMNLGAMDLAANLYWLTWQDETDSEAGNTETDNDFWDIGGNVTFSNKPSANSFFWAAGLDFLRHTNETIVDAAEKTETTHQGAATILQPRFDLAFPVLSSENAKVSLGLNSRLPIYLYDEYNNPKVNTSTFGLYTSPNILGEIAVTENWLVYGSAYYEWELIGIASTEVKSDPTQEQSSITMQTRSTYATMGARFQYNNFVLEASVANNLGSANWDGLVARVGGFILF